MGIRTTLGYSNYLDQFRRITNEVGDVTTTYIYNDIGSADIAIPYSATSFDSIIRWGNIYRIYRLNLQPWTGVAISRTWNNGSVTLQLKSGEYILKDKKTKQGLLPGQGGLGTTGQVASALFRSAVTNSLNAVPLNEGDFDASIKRFAQYDYADLYDSYIDLAKEGGAFWVDTDLNVHFRDQRGRDRSSYVKLRENEDLIIDNVVEDSENVTTHIVALGDGADVVSKPKIARYLSNDYFYRAKVVDYQGVGSPETLRELAEEELRLNREPQIKISASVSDFNNRFFIGDIVELIIYRMGNRKLKALVIGLEVDTEGKTKAVFEVLVEPGEGTPRTWRLG